MPACHCTVNHAQDFPLNRGKNPGIRVVDLPEQDIQIAGTDRQLYSWLLVLTDHCASIIDH